MADKTALVEEISKLSVLEVSELVKALEELNFSRIPSIIALPELLDMQKASMREFLQRNVSPDKRKIQGLQAAFMDVFPISNNDESLTLEFVAYDLGEPRYTMDEALTK